MAITIAQLNAADRAAFVAAVGFTFEGSPWIAEEAWSNRPFDSVDAVLGAMKRVVAAAPEERRVALIGRHPDLAGRLAREGGLTIESAREQAVAGLDELNAQEIARFDAANSAYRDRFGFPFVICVREQSKASILAELDRRLSNERTAEIATALDEIGKIARLRLADVLGA